MYEEVKVPWVTPGEEQPMHADEAIRIAELWRADKIIAADEDEVRNALLEEVLRLRREYLLSEGDD